MIVNFYFSISGRAFIVLQNGVKLTEVCVGGTNSAQIYYSHYSKAILENLE